MLVENQSTLILTMALSNTLIVRVAGQTPELVQERLPLPTPGPGQVQVKVSHVAQNPTDGDPYLISALILRI